MKFFEKNFEEQIAKKKLNELNESIYQRIYKWN